MLHRQSQQIDISQLSRSVHASDIERLRVQQTHIIGPEFMRAIGRGATQSLSDFDHGTLIGITCVRKNS